MKNSRQELEAMTTKGLREIAKVAAVKNYWLLKKADMIEQILAAQNQIELVEVAPEVETVEVETVVEPEVETVEVAEPVVVEVEKTEAPKKEKAPKKEGTRTRTMKKVHVVLEDGTEMDFDSRTACTQFFNAKHNTEYNNDMTWYIIRGKNKKVQKLFEIKEITEI